MLRIMSRACIYLKGGGARGGENRGTDIDDHAASPLQTKAMRFQQDPEDTSHFFSHIIILV